MPLFGPEVILNFDDVIYYKNNEADKKLENNWNNILKPVVDELDSVGVLEVKNILGVWVFNMKVKLYTII